MVYFLDHDADMLVEVNYLVGVSHILVGQLRDVHQTVLVDADVDEGTEIGDVGDDAGQSSNTLHYAFSPLSVYASHPDQVITDAAGQYYVNYTDIMPVLVEAIKQLHAMVSSSAVNGNGTDEESGSSSATPVMKTPSASCSLLQIKPNPFTKATIIRYALPPDMHDARLCITDMQDTPLREIPLNGSSDRVILSSSGLDPGMYVCTLMVNGKDVKKMRIILAPK